MNSTSSSEPIQASIFRNLQDYINLDRAAYIWKKQASYQADVQMNAFNNLFEQLIIPSPTQDSQRTSNKLERLEDENETKI